MFGAGYFGLLYVSQAIALLETAIVEEVIAEEIRRTGMGTDVDTAGGYLVPSGGGGDYWWPDAKPFPVTGVAVAHPLPRYRIRLGDVAATGGAWVEGLAVTTRVGMVAARGGIGAQATTRNLGVAARIGSVSAHGIQNPLREMIAILLLDRAA